jgi:DNA polymerase IV (DinB-like DNA polymerase)
MGRIIIHVDMDHFFTAIEERERPEIRGKPVVVGADPKKGRGVVSTCNYEARKFGIRSGMPITRAYKLCPEAIFLPVNFQLYKKVSERIMAILRNYSDRLERWGLDEAFLDVSTKVRDYEGAEALAKRIKGEIYEGEGLTCSIGIGPNKLIAKVASDLNKPDGLTVVREEEAKDFLAPLPVRKLIGVGRKTERKMKELGIQKVGDLASFDSSKLSAIFGKFGLRLYLMAHGIDESEVREKEERKSISREITFDEDTDDFHFILEVIDTLCSCLHTELTRRKLSFRTVTLKVRYENFETHVFSKTLPHPAGFQHLRNTAKDLLLENLGERKLRLVGLRLSNLIPMKGQRRLEPFIESTR